MENRKPLGKLYGKKVAVLVTDGFEESELTEPVKALRAAGAEVEILSDHAGEVQAFRHLEKTIRVKVDRTLEQASPEDYDGLELPGGALNADRLRVNERAQAFVREFFNWDKPVAAICHAPWILISSGLARGRRLTSYHTIADDVRNAGGHWIDERVVEDNNLITSRRPGDLPAFNEAMVRKFASPHPLHAAG